ncbi:MAG: flagellar export protein FliJ [Thermodesulfobacteriota bacterium]
MAYRFRLETVLGLRRNLEELAQQRLAKELLALEELVARLAELREQRQGLIDEFEEKKQGLMDAPLFISYMDGISMGERRIEECGQAIERQQQAVAAAREELAAKMRDRKVMEKARERDYQRHVRAQLAKEQNEADEQMVLRFGRHGGGQ